MHYVRLEITPRRSRVSRHGTKLARSSIRFFFALLFPTCSNAREIRCSLENSMEISWSWFYNCWKVCTTLLKVKIQVVKRIARLFALFLSLADLPSSTISLSAAPTLNETIFLWNRATKPLTKRWPPFVRLIYREFVSYFNSFRPKPFFKLNYIYIHNLWSM